MKLADALQIIRAESGYRVHFEKRDSGLLYSDYFPERHEPSIKDLDEAWRLADQFSRAAPNVYVNIYVISAADWSPVEGYMDRKLNTSWTRG